MSSKLEASDAIGSRYQLAGDAIAQCARDAWGPDACRRPGEQLGSLFGSQMITNPGERASVKDVDCEPIKGSDSRLDRVHVTRNESTPGVSVREYRGLDKSYLKDKSPNPGRAPDATVVIPKDFDPVKPIRVVIFNHGFNGSGKNWAENQQLAKQMAQADPNTILVIPEWQQNPGGTSPPSSEVCKPNFFRNQLQEIFNSTPELRGKKVDDIQSMGIIAHSAGGKMARLQLENSGFDKKVDSVTVLDARYDDNIYSDWIRRNAEDLQSGRKTFIFVHGDDKIRPDADRQGQSPNVGRFRRDVMEAETRTALGRFQVPDSAYGKREPGDPDVYKRGGVIFIHDADHMNLPRNHVNRVLAADSRPRYASR